MIALALPARAEAHAPYVGRISRGNDVAVGALRIVETAPGTTVLAGPHGLVAIDHDPATDLVGDVILVVPAAGRVERLIRHGSMHNSLLVTERCDQLCVMCSQPPKKTHDDRFAFFEEACLLADRDAVIGITGGEPTLFKDALLAMIERVLEARPDLAFHVLTNGQHFDATDAERLAQSAYRRVQWGIPLYADDPETHDTIVGKPGAFARLEDSLATLACAGAGIELRTVILQSNVAILPGLARHIARRLPFVASWSIMQLENVGFARNRWASLRVNHLRDFSSIAGAIDQAALHGIAVQLFNFPRCTVPPAYRDFAVASISDWKQKFARACANCRERAKCAGFFEWHPDAEIDESVTPL